MALPAESPPCHLLRTPYEILKPILAELSQIDQISASKTCVSLWQLAYPMACNRITVEIGPNRRESEWQHLASGVGLRYVQHLDIRSLHCDKEESKHIEDLVAVTLITAIRRNQLRSFSVIMPIASTRAISVKTVVILMETQRSLEQLVLPCVEEPRSICFDGFVHQEEARSALRYLSFTVTSSTISGEVVQNMLENSSKLREVHLRLQPLDNHDDQEMPPVLLKANSPRSRLLSLVTKLTIQGYRFRFGTAMLRVLLPALRALAVIDCLDTYNLFYNLKPTGFPQLRALMIIDSKMFMSHALESFIREAAPLRELVLEGEGVAFGQHQSFAKHADSLELLSLHRTRSENGIEYAAISGSNDAVETLFRSFTALRHLSINAPGLTHLGPQGKIYNFHGHVQMLLGIFAAYERLHTLHFRCRSALHNSLSKFYPQDANQLQQNNLHEDEIASVVAEKLLNTTAPCVAESPLKYLAVTVDCIAGPPSVSTEQLCRVPYESLTMKYMRSLKPSVARKSVDQLKEEIMRRYESEGYYFLEAHVNGMKKLSAYILDLYQLNTSMEDMVRGL